MRVEGSVVDAGWGSGDLAVVGCRVEVDDMESALEQLDGRNKRLALNAILIQLVGVAVGRGYQHDAVRHEGLEETTQNHGIGHVGALELVEAQYIGLLGDFSGHEGHGVDVAAILHLHLVQALVNILHEVVEVDACLGPHRRWERVVEEIHQHRLAAAHIAVQVQALGEVRGNRGDG